MTHWKDRIAVSHFNFMDKARARMPMPESVTIYDSTLRDGEQMPGVCFSHDQKIEIARKLDLAGVPEIDAGFPAVSENERRTIKKIANTGLDARILALTRLRKEDVEMAADCDVDIALLFIGTSPLHLEKKLRMTEEDVKARALECIDHAKAHGIIPSLSSEDSTRTDIRFLKELAQLAEGAGAKRFGFTDTVGCATSEAIAYACSELRASHSLPMSAHLHNDFGLVLPNAVAAVASGAQHICTTINGWGERAGNVPLEQFVMAMEVMYGVRTGVDTTMLTELSHLVSGFTKIPVARFQPFVGDNAFRHESGIHVAAMVEDERCYEPVPPEMVGNERRLILGKHSGRKIVARKLQDAGVAVSPRECDRIVKKVKTLGETTGHVDDEAFWEIVKAVTHGKVDDGREDYEIDEMADASGRPVTGGHREPAL